MNLKKENNEQNMTPKDCLNFRQTWTIEFQGKAKIIE